MDALAALLTGPSAQDAFLLRALLTPPWSILVRDEAPLSLIAMVRGHAWVAPGGDQPVRVEPGGLVLVKGPEPYLFADDPATPPQVVIHPGQHCASPDGTDLSEAMMLGVRTWGHPEGSAVMLIGTYQLRGEVSDRLLAALPRLVVLPPTSWRSPLVPVLADEIVREQPGQEVVLDRLLDLLLIGAVRTWFTRPGAEPPAWYRAHADPVVGRALQLLHANPAHPWSVASLAEKVGVSRATLARRFTELVGEAPMAYLTGWRLALAADLLAGSADTVDAVARRVGYGTGFALSAAFKRERGISPREYRRRSAGTG